MAFSLRCPVCRVKFPWNPTEGMPDLCPNEDCNSRIGADIDDNVICMPAIRSSAKTKATDKVYRDIEAASIQRAEAAAEMAGVPVADMADLKITDLRPTRHEGDVAAVPVNNAVTQIMNNPIGQQAFGFQGANGVGFSGPVQTGVAPNSGAHFQKTLRHVHAERVGWDKVGDAPALEMSSPLYRPRV